MRITTLAVLLTAALGACAAVAMIRGRIPTPSWWGVWAGWGLVLLTAGVTIGLVQLTHHHLVTSPYKIPSCHAHRWVGREAWRQWPWARVQRRWIWGNTLGALPLMTLIVAAPMWVISGLQALVIVGLLPALNLHHTMMPTQMALDGVTVGGRAVVLLLNLALPLAAFVILMGCSAHDAIHQAFTVWKGWTFLPTRDLRAQSPAWSAVLNEAWDDVLRQNRLLPVDHQRRSSRGGSLLTQAVLLKAPSAVLDHLLTLGCDPQRSWTPWDHDVPLGDWLKQQCEAPLLAGQTLATTLVRPRCAWRSWDHPLNVEWPLDYLIQANTLQESRALRQAIGQALIEQQVSSVRPEEPLAPVILPGRARARL